MTSEFFVFTRCYAEEGQQAFVAAAIQDVLVRAGLGDEPDVRASSVAAWAGRRVLAETGRIDVAAGRGSRPERDGKHVAEKRTDRDRPPGRTVQPGELGVVAEAAAGEVEGA